jgi:hypothetical protein
MNKWNIGRGARAYIKIFFSGSFISFRIKNNPRNVSISKMNKSNFIPQKVSPPIKYPM